VLSLLELENIIPRRILDVGCGNGAVAAQLADRGWDVIGVDPSDSAVRTARAAHPAIVFHQASAYDDLADRLGRFRAVLSLEVVEHVYFPRAFASTLFKCLEPGGIAIVSTPYHGYLKNVALALTGRMDRHFTALWDHGHIKFWSIRSLRALLLGAGFSSIEFLRVGRIPCLAKSMIAIAHRDTPGHDVLDCAR
jgi:2-polyprenyl-6-hydroxyphenyl methylase/3-demethylubiquinone-9 3-methyltransferase